MKTPILILTFCLNTFFLQANHLFSELNLRLFDNSAFQVILNKQSASPASTNVTLSGLASGRHHLKVIKHNYNHHGQLSPQIIYNGFINVPASFQLFALIDIYNRLNIINQVPLYQTYNPYHPVHCPPAFNGFSPAVFAQLKQAMMNTSFDSNRLRIAEQAMVQNGITSQQVLELMGLLIFESNKLKFAKSAYSHTIDRHNYFLVNNGFTFSSSINSLNNHINKFY
jgi:hypothetical protein